MHLFNYDSKFMQFLGMFADMVIMNVLFVICSLPVFTIGAAQAGLFSGLRVLMDKDNDEYCYRAFFKGFANGFKKITLLWTLLLVLMALMGWSLAMIYTFRFENATVAIWFGFIALGVMCVYSSVLTSFHAKFDCTAKQLLKNAWYTMLSHPIRSLLLGALVWLPTGLFIWDTYTFMRLTVIFITMYHSVAYFFGNVLMEKHYQRLTELVMERNGETAPAAEVTEDTEEATEE